MTASADLMLRRGNFDGAITILEPAVQRYDRLDLEGSSEATRAVVLLADAYRRAHRENDAENLLTAAYQSLPDQPWYDSEGGPLPLLDGLAAILEARGQYAQAEEIHSQASILRESIRGVENEETLRSTAALINVRLAQPGRAPSAIEPARRLVQALLSRRERLLGGLNAHRQAAPRQEESRWALLYADAEWEASGQAPGPVALPAELFRALQVASGTQATRAMATMAARRLASGAGERAARLVRDREEASSRWLALRASAIDALALQGADAEPVRERLAVEQSAVEQSIAVIDEQLRAEFPDYHDLIRPREIDMSALQAILDEQDAILLIVPGPRGTHVLGITRDGMIWQRSDWTEQQVDAAVQRLRWNVGAQPFVSAEQIRAWEAERQADEPMSFDRGTAYQLYLRTIAPVAPLLAGKTRIYAVAAGPLAGLPLSLLVTQPPLGSDDDPDDLRATAWLAESRALVHAPSIQSLLLLRRTVSGDGSPDLAFIGIGDPVLSGPPAESVWTSAGGLPRGATALEAARGGDRLANASALRTLSPLPGFRAELDGMRDEFGADRSQLIDRGDATERRVRAVALDRARVIAFSTHGLMPADIVVTNRGPRYASDVFGIAEPGLVMTPPAQASAADDGYLGASEVTGLRLGADWVILSACNTATGTPDDPGLSQLAQAFFYAGARSLLASHWPVHDQVAQPLTVGTINLERGGRPRPEAFQQAMRDVRMNRGHDTATETWAHPYFWAPFVLVDGVVR